MTLEKLLQGYSQLLNVDSYYNSTILKQEDSCAAKSKYLYGYYLNCLICRMIEKENDIQSIKDFVTSNFDNFRFDYKIIATIFARHLSMHLSDTASYTAFSNYILNHCPFFNFRKKAEQILSFVDKKQFEAALEIIKSLS